MPEIIPHLWYDKEAKDAAKFYCSLFPNSKIINITTLHDTPSGNSDIVSFELAGQKFVSISAGPFFKFNPSISFFINFDPSRDKEARKNLDTVWKKLSEGGTELMPLDKYPFSEHYGWIQDKYGLSWQLILTDPEGEERPFIVPSLLFVGDVCGKAEEASNFYLSVFKNTKQGITARYPKGMPARTTEDVQSGGEPDKEGTIMFTDFMIENQWFAAMDSAHEHNFAFNEAVSFMVSCETQKEIDYFWKKLSAVPQAEQCGWLKDKYGISWQIVPTILPELLASQDSNKKQRAMQNMLQMKKIIIEDLQNA